MAQHLRDDTVISLNDSALLGHNKEIFNGVEEVKAISSFKDRTLQN